MSGSNRTRNLFLGFITVFLDDMGYSIVVPILPYFSASLGASSMQEGVLFICVNQAVSIKVILLWEVEVICMDENSSSFSLSWVRASVCVL
ncbi:multidrug resistance protein [Blastocystis sp. subtype 4]|uniref:multidrug resistance protein n=1 Tax=Blastocystis sp. subtype 4 TaxID=944170 RepID=UPI0007119D37|nr:multidrug resistance protein [Blastocystis sp. subtype 4]KNB41306.1 multidrug resistance protein [Blastocystis sp. subtype 4]|eukprot:XP_014524749.1 multidrug resistance protein [Blastocystis sp. subtype 4]